MSEIFLNDNDVADLTGRKRKSDQIDALRSMGIPFFINAEKRPIVTRKAVEGGDPVENKPQPWHPKVLSKNPNG